MWGRGNRGGRGGDWGFRGDRGGRGFDRGGRGGYRGGGGGKRFFGNTRERRGGGGAFDRRSFDNANAGQWRSHRQPTRDSPGKRISEDAIGVTEYVSDHQGFTGVIKSRYSDFQVAEINEQGVMAQLTDLSIPTVPVVDAEIVEDEDLLLSKYNLEILPMETWDRINELAVAKGQSNDKVEVDVTGMSKEHRTKVHDAVKKAFGESIVGSTVTTNEDGVEKKFCKFEKYRKGVRIDNRVKWPFPGEYVHFIVHKENCDTMEAAATIAERLRSHIRPAMIGYAGTKDRRAKTSQWFSVRKILPKRLSDAVQHLPHIHVGNYTFSKTHLKLGMLKGNHFRIALRNVTADDSVVDLACSRLQERGFINYYGLQRFGTRADRPTFDIGLKLLKGDLKEAINYILEDRPGPLSAALQSLAASGSAAAALRLVPRGAPPACIEVRLLAALARQPADLLGAINKLARNTRVLYVHAYQSLVWNRAVSRRLASLGPRVAVGDLVPLATLQEEAINEEAICDDEEENSEESDAQDGDSKNGEHNDDERTDTQDAGDGKKDVKTNKSEPVRTKEPVKVLTQADIDSGKYSIFDIIMPMPGQHIEYPPNMKDVYEELLTKDGLTLEMKNKVKSFSMSGAYRHVVVRPQGLSWRRVSYGSPTADLLRSDIDRLNRPQQTDTDGNGRASPDVEPGQYSALLLEMTLPSSCYATMALRELMKVSTSSDSQAAQNNYHLASTSTPVNASEKDNESSSKIVEDSSNKRKMETENELEVKRLKEESDTQ